MINASDFVDIRRHHDVDRAFKFVSLDSEDAIDYGKDGPNHDKVKGTIEARFYLEKKQPEVRHIHHDHHHHHDHYIPTPRPRPPWVYPPPQPMWQNENLRGNTCGTYGDSSDGGDGGSGDNMSLGDPPAGHMNCSAGGGTTSSLGSGGVKRSRSRRVYGSSKGAGAQSAQPASFNFAAPEQPLQDGCTVEGYSTGQNFHSAYCDTEEQYTSLKIFLQGHSDSEAVEVVEPRQQRPTNKDRILDDLEAENDRLRRELAEKENKELKEKLEQLDE